MLLKFFKSNHPYIIFMIPLLGIVLWMPSLFNINQTYQPASTDNATLVFQWINQFIAPYPKTSVWLALVFLILQSYFLIRLNFKYIFLETKTYLPSVLYILFGSAFLSYQQLHPVLIANFFLLFAINKSFVIDKDRNQIQRYLESGFFLGISALFYPHYYVFILLIWLALLILRNSTWREWMAPIIGFTIPVAILFLGLFFYNQQILLVNNLKNIFLTTSTNRIYSHWAIIPLGVIAFALAVAILWGLLYVGAKKISARKYYTLFFWFLILISAAFIFHPSIGFEIIYILAIPLSILFSIFFTESRKSWVLETLFGFIFISAIALIWIH